MIYNTLLPLIKKTKSPLSPREFQERINIVFHDFEASQYDLMHKDMWESLQEQINLLVADLLKRENYDSRKLNLLDIGCGTGLSTQMLLNSKLGVFIDEITLLDTSKNMLKFAEEKAKNWNKKYKIVNGYLLDLKQKHDVIIICSVLHHIPDLKIFLSEVENNLSEDGILIHLQDPNGDYINDTNYLERVGFFESEMNLKAQKKSLVNLMPKKWKHFVNRQLGRLSYIDLVNNQLMVENVIKKRMSADEIWSVTDIHVETKENRMNKGISFQFLQKQLFNFELINFRSYGFYGALKSQLPDKFKKIEEELISKNELNGRNISCLWKKKTIAK